MKSIFFEDINLKLEEFLSSQQISSSQELKETKFYPKISIVTPTYNQGNYIEYTILSVLNQNYPNLEYIIIDGGSTDNTVDIIKKYEKYITCWVSEKDNGQSEAIRKGFDMATGDLFMWQNSDDVYMPGAFFYIANIFFKNSSYDVFYGDKYIIDQKNTIVSERKLVQLSQKLIKLSSRYGGFGIYQPASVWKRTLYYEVGGVDKSFQFCMDNDLISKFILNNAKFLHINYHITAFRVHKDSKTTNLRAIAKKEIERISENKGLEYYSKPNCIRFILQMYKIIKYFINGNLKYVLYRKFIDKYKWVP